MAYNSAQKLKDNIAAIRVAIAFKNGTPVDAEGLEILKKFSGFGGIKAILFPPGDEKSWLDLNAKEQDMKLYPAIMELHNILKENFSEKHYHQLCHSIKNSSLTAFFTPPVVADVLYEVLKENNIYPKRIYEPSAGAGVFITKAIEAFSDIQQITLVEKDLLTGGILKAIGSCLNFPTKVHVSGFENAPVDDNGKYDFIVSNIPFGNFPVYDKDFPSPSLSGKIHNYFFAKGLDKLSNGGLMAYITTDAFLNTPSNKEAREYLFQRADFISVSVMPDNLMKDTGNTEAPNHLLIVQKNETKQALSGWEKYLLETVKAENEFGSYYTNKFLQANPQLITGNEVKAGKNQYGTPNMNVWQTGDINQIRGRLRNNINVGINENLNKASFKNAQSYILPKPEVQKKKLTFLPLPNKNEDTTTVQLGLFDTTPAESINRAIAYINDLDATVVKKQTARIIGMVKTEDNPDHESFVLVAAKAAEFKQYVYKLYSNVEEISFGANWKNAAVLSRELKGLSNELKLYEHQYRFEGDKSMEAAFFLEPSNPSLVSITKPFYIEGTLVIHKGLIGTINNIETDTKKALFLPFAVQNELERHENYIALRDKYLELTFNVPADQISKRQRETLNGLYESFVNKYGILNNPPNKKFIGQDVAHGFIILSSLERRQGEQFLKSDLLNDSLSTKQEYFSTSDPLAALAYCLNEQGKVDIPFIATALGEIPNNVIDQLGNHIYINPGTNEWETADQYLSGNVVLKLQTALNRVSDQNEIDFQLQRSLDAIQKVQPEKIPFDLLDFNLGERWIPVEYYNRFSSELFDLNTTISYFRSTDIFKVVAAGRNLRISEEYAVVTKSGSTVYANTILEHALENTTPFLTYEIETVEGKKIRVPDNDAIQVANEEIEKIRSRFIEWLRELPETEKNTITNLYNDTYNCYVLREYNGSHQSFPKLNKEGLGINDLYSSQKNAIWRIIQNRGALIDHEVGLGKTLTMVVAGQEMKRLGTIHKPMILALKSNVAQIAETYNKAYPDARILFPDEKDFTPTGRMRIFLEIKNNNWDCIILTHDQFSKIPQAPEIQREIFETELQNVERDLKTLKELGGEISKKMLKGLEIRKNNLEIKLSEVLTRIEERKDNDINFRDLGVDHLFIDEAHKFKNLTFTTRHNRVAGLGNTEGSQKALNMLFAVRELQTRFNADLCATFLSGTPISNSLTEMYLLFKYLRPRELERQQIENFDAWAAVFARKSVDFEFSVTNEIIPKERFRYFIKVPELALFYNEITDYKTAEHINLDKPRLDEVLVNIRLSSDQLEFSKNLMAFARTGNAELIGRSPLTEQEDKARMLIATNYAKKMAVDMRLINERYPDDPDNKINVCARNVAELYRQSTPHRGTQIVFCDMGTPTTAGFNLYAAFKEKLIRDMGILAHEIAFIHDWQGKKKPQLFEKMNKGEIRILLGSTEMAGTGLNVQKRVVASHHIDVPWTPKDLDQRNGRGARQGNLIAKLHYENKVKNFIYGKEQSLDNYKFNLLKNKQTFINQMKNCELNVRTIDEGAFDEKGGMNYSEYIAILSGDTSLLEKSRLEKKIAVLENLRVAHFREINKTKYRLEAVFKEKEKGIELLEKLKIDQGVYKGNLIYNKDGTKNNPLQLIGNSSDDTEVLGKYLIHLYQDAKVNQSVVQDQKIGTLYGFDCYMQSNRRGHIENNEWRYQYENHFYVQSPHTDLRYTYNEGFPNVDNPKITARIFLNAIDRVNNIIEQRTKALEDIDKNIPMMQELIVKPFSKDDDLKSMKLELARLERDINIKIQEKKLEQPSHEFPDDVKVQVSIHKDVIKMDAIERKTSIRSRVISHDEVGEAVGIRR